MTKALYHNDSYQKEFDAIITAVSEENHGVVLDQTIFYPGGGGQPADFGILTFDGQTYPIKRAKKIKGETFHLLEKEVTLPDLGTPVHGELDWEHRYKLMRTHTAMHILCGVIFRDYGASVTGGNMEPLKGRMDFEFASMHKELVEKIEIAINAEVAKAHPVSWRVLPREEAFQIPDLIRTKINLLPKFIQEVRIVEI
ncbi:MAG: alanyl-tRNA editing protein, partial [Chloroflexota bacterium]|nr:alanyl-tRNA editing protein [Chloroflexota bacterium]